MVPNLGQLCPPLGPASSSGLGKGQDLISCASELPGGWASTERAEGSPWAGEAGIRKDQQELLERGEQQGWEPPP